MYYDKEQQLLLANWLVTKLTSGYISSSPKGSGFNLFFNLFN